MNVIVQGGLVDLIAMSIIVQRGLVDLIPMNIIVQGGLVNLIPMNVIVQGGLVHGCKVGSNVNREMLFLSWKGCVFLLG